MSLSEKAMLVDLNISQWGAKVEDKRATDMVLNNSGAQTNSGKFYKKLMDKYTTKISRIANKARMFHNYNTIPWDRDGRSILPVKNYFYYVEEMGKIKQEMMRVVDEFLTNYGDELEEEKNRLQGLFNPSDYPTVEELRSKYNLHYIMEPIPTSGDFRVDIQAEEVEKLKAQLEERLKEKTEEAVKELFQRLYNVVTHLSNRLKEKSNNPKARLHESTVNNIKALCDTLPRLNLTGNKELEELTERVERELTAFTIDDMKDDEIIRHQTIKAAEALADKIAEFM